MGLALFVSKFASKEDLQPKKISSGEAKDGRQPEFETPAQRRLRVRTEKLKNVSERITGQIKEWDPSKPSNAAGVQKTEDAYKTLFVYNIPFTTVEQRIHDEFEGFGPVTSVVMPKDFKGMPRGYAFVEFERERDLKIAYREANGIRIEGRRVYVDVERGRTVKEWLPNRLGGTNNSSAKKRRSEKKDGRLPR